MTRRSWQLWLTFIAIAAAVLAVPVVFGFLTVRGGQ